MGHTPNPTWRHYTHLLSDTEPAIKSDWLVPQLFEMFEDSSISPQTKDMIVLRMCVIAH